jgi:hypothetical protein
VPFGRIILTPRLATGLLVETTLHATTQRDRDAANALAQVLRTITDVFGPNPRGEETKGGEQVLGNADVQAPKILTVGIHPPPPLELEQ